LIFISFDIQDNAPFGCMLFSPVYLTSLSSYLSNSPLTPLYSFILHFISHHLFNYNDGESIPLNCQFTSTTVHDITPQKDRYFHSSHPHPKNLTYQMIHFHKSQECK